MNECELCLVLQQFDGVTRPFAEGIFQTLSGPTADLFRTFLSMWFLFMGMSMFINPRQARQTLDGAAVKILVGLFIFGILANPGIMWRYAFEPVQDLSIAMSMAIIEFASSMGTGGNLLSPPGNVPSGYAKLFGMAEKQLYNLVKTSFNYLESLSIFDGAGFVAAAISGFILWFLFGLVLLVFGFFLIEAQFYFLAVGALAPLLLIAYFFDATKKFTMAGVSMIVLAGVSILTAAIAMGFTVGVIHFFENDFACSIDAPSCLLQDGATKKKIADTLPMMLLIGFISLLLHIKSKTIASAFSGVQDSAAPATLVAMGAKMASLGTLGTAFQLMGGGALKGAYQQSIAKGGLGRLAVDGTIAAAKGAASGAVGGFRRLARRV